MKQELKDLLDLLDLEQIEVNMFRGVSPAEGWQRVYGGQVIGQALVAAYRTVEDRAALPTRCTAISCAPATRPSRSSTRSIGFAMATVSTHGG